MQFTHTLRGARRRFAKDRTVRKAGQLFTSFEGLEARQLMSASVESIDGSGNNLSNPALGSVGVDLLRKAAAGYADGASTPAGADRPSARLISNAIATADVEIPNSRNMSAMVYAWGQFLDHDMDLTPTAGAEEMDISIPYGDASFDPNSTGEEVMPMSRSIYDAATGSSAANPRQQVNTITAWIDGSVVYGSDAARASAVQSFVGGALKTGEGGTLPLNDGATPMPNANDAHLYSDDQLFLAGDVRANENIELTSLQTLFMREHNRIAAKLAAQHPGFSDEQLFQAARKVVIGEIQSITYNEFLPALMGQNALKRYRGYDPAVNPGIANEFSSAAFRLGHSMLGEDVEFLDNNGLETQPELALSQTFFNPQVIKDSGIDGILKYLASDRAQEIDNKVVDGVRNFLFGPPGSGGLDLASLNIQRGRDNGLADYNTVRAAYGLPRVTNFAQITSNPALQQTLKSLYGSVDNIDLWVGGLAENHLAGSSLGPTFQRILADQFQRLRDGDRFWYERNFTGQQLSEIRNTRLSDIIARNTGTTNLQQNVFNFDASISGTVFSDANRNARQDRRESGLRGLLVTLSDADGNVLATDKTDAYGDYAFGALDLGSYVVNVTLPAGLEVTGGQPAAVKLTRAGAAHGIDLGVARNVRNVAGPLAGALAPAPEANAPFAGPAGLDDPTANAPSVDSFSPDADAPADSLLALDPDVLA